MLPVVEILVVLDFILLPFQIRMQSLYTQEMLECALKFHSMLELDDSHRNNLSFNINRKHD